MDEYFTIKVVHYNISKFALFIIEENLDDGEGSDKSQKR